MREILFRGKRIDNGEWIKGFYCQVADEFDGGARIKQTILVSTFLCQSGFKLLEVDSETVGQYTGLTDKNGKKIFEGDCFKTYCTGLPVYKHIVGYYPEHFAFMARCIEMNTVHYLSDYRPSAIEVIGNIHDNPDLLGGE